MTCFRDFWDSISTQPLIISSHMFFLARMG
jgi:hypothetical protein